VWRNLAQGGEDKDWRMGSLVPKVKTLNPMYIRVDHIYDFCDIVKKENGQLIFNWTKFDLVINDILATGAKPFISLSYMPPSIAKDGDITGTPSSWQEYQTVIYNTINHLSKERGITDVYYEVWNEPDLFGQWKTYGKKNYLTLYSAASNAAKQITNAKTFKLGGPGTTALYKNWFDALAKQSIDNNMRLDFISWHRYSNDIDQFQKDIVEANSWMQDYPQLANTELLITEWGT
jgi:xylan 1,4-beta-xylosidase